MNREKLVKLWQGQKLSENYYKSNLNDLEAVFRFSKDWIYHPLKRKVARGYLEYLRKQGNLKVIGITGSAGKSTTKEMISSILKQHDNTVYSRDNIDPVFNIPSTIFRSRTNSRYLVLEMGIEYPGDMDFYMWLAKPDVSVITNIDATHTEYFGDVQGVLEEKGKIIKSLGKSDYAVLNRDDENSSNLSRETVARIIWFGNGTKIEAKSIRITEKFTTTFELSYLGKSINIELPVVGKQFVENSLAAACVASIFSIDYSLIKKGLESFNPMEHRMKIFQHDSGATIVDDSYNNNPRAAKLAIDTLLQISNITNQHEKIVVFGDMLELGKLDRVSHEKLGEYLARKNIKYLIGVGNLTKYLGQKAIKAGMNKDHVYHVDKWSDALSILNPILNTNTVVLIKGSRSIGLEKLIEKL